MEATRKVVGLARDGALVFSTGLDDRGRQVSTQATVRKVGFLNDGTTWNLTLQQPAYPQTRVNGDDH